MWITNDELVGKRVSVRTGYGEWASVEVIAVSDKSERIKVIDDEGDTMAGDEWEE